MSAQVSAAEWQRIKTLFLLALETPPADRDALLAREAAGDANLLREVQSLLASHEQQGALDRAPDSLRWQALDST